MSGEVYRHEFGNGYIVEATFDCDGKAIDYCWSPKMPLKEDYSVMNGEYVEWSKHVHNTLSEKFGKCMVVLIGSEVWCFDPGSEPERWY